MRPPHGAIGTGNSSIVPEVKLPSKTWPVAWSKVRSRGNRPVGTTPTTADRCASAAAVLMTLTVCGIPLPVPGTRPRLELPTSARRPSSTRSNPTGSDPTRTTARSARDESARISAAEKPSSASDCNAVTHTVLPSGDTATRTGWQPAAMWASTAPPSAPLSARAVSMTHNWPCGPYAP